MRNFTFAGIAVLLLLSLLNYHTILNEYEFYQSKDKLSYITTTGDHRGEILSTNSSVAANTNGGFCGSEICNILHRRLSNQKEENFRFYSSSELEMTKHFTINKRNYCGNNRGEGINLISIVFSTVSKFLQRNAIRETWGKQLKEKGVSVMFLIAKSLNKTVQKKVNEEDSKFKDLIQSPFIDNYYNETLKAIAMLNTLHENCRQVKFVLKTDEDVIINVKNVFRLMKKRNNPRKVIFGSIFIRVNVIRSVTSKWYVPSYVYKPNKYPRYPNGPIFMFTGDSTEALLKNCYTLSPFYIDDAYVMGIVAQKSGVRRAKVAAIGKIKESLNENGFQRNLGVHDPKNSFNHIKILQLWSTYNL